MLVSKWGNSLAIRLPAAVVEALGLKEGDDVRVTVRASHDLEIERTPDSAELLRRLRASNVKLPPDWRFDRDEANAR